MPKQKISLLVEGGKASASPPLGTQLGPMKVNVAKVVEEINEETKALKGMQVPVDVEVDLDTKNFEITIGTPPVSALIKKELGLEKGSAESGKLRVGDLKPEQVKKIARAKFGDDSQAHFNQVKGTARSMGITVGEGEVTEEEIQKYEEEKAAEEAEAEARKAEGAAPEGAVPEGEAAEAKEGEEKPEEKKEERPSEEKKPEEKKE